VRLLRSATFILMIPFLMGASKGCQKSAGQATANVILKDVPVRIAIGAAAGAAKATLSVIGNNTGIRFQDNKVLATIFNSLDPSFGASPKAPQFRIVDKTHDKVLTWELTNKVAEISITPPQSGDGTGNDVIPVERLDIINKSPLQIVVWVTDLNALNIDVHLK
jgi:hypothetical protein